MKKLIIISSILLMAIVVSAQVKFENSLSWKEIQAKAKKEKKYIFVDVMATWCVPCKKMDSEVYSKHSVGQLLNSEFISVKLQMDSTAQDNDMIKSWRKTASEIKKKYRIRAFPTYLFLSPEGIVVQKGTGYLAEDEFVSIVKAAKNPNNEYYNSYKEYLKGKRDYNKLPYLVMMSAEFGEKDFSARVAKDYINNYLMSLPKNRLYTEDNIYFIASHLTLSDKKAFGIFQNNGDKINALLKRKNYSSDVIANLITTELIIPKLKKRTEPNWSAISSKVSKIYGHAAAENAINTSQAIFYYNEKKWVSAAKARIRSYDTNGLDTSNIFAIRLINNFCWYDVFQKISDPDVLNKAIGYMSVIVHMKPPTESGELSIYINSLDTYANLLHKLGRTNEAIEWEEKAISLNPKAIDLKETLEKFKRGERTWSDAK